MNIILSEEDICKFSNALDDAYSEDAEDLSIQLEVDKKGRIINACAYGRVKTEYCLKINL